MKSDNLPPAPAGKPGPPLPETLRLKLQDPVWREAVREENRKLRYLRFMVDLALAEIRAGSFTPAQARQVVENIRSQALQLFPGKETAFEWIYRPRFRRAMTETFGCH